ncbi:MAG: RNA polymerase sigma factor [Bacteroidota bacterium]
MYLPEDKYTGLLSRVQRGDRAATNEICELLRQELQKGLSWRINDSGTIDDIIQETLIWFLRNHQKIQSKESVAAFVARKAFFLTKNYYMLKYANRSRFTQLTEETGAVREDSAVYDDEHQNYCYKVILEQLKKIPGRYRDTLTLHYIEGKSYSEIAEILGISYQNVKIRMFRGVQLLQRRTRKLVTLMNILLTSI